MFRKLVRIVFFFFNWLVVSSIVIFYVDFIANIIFIDLCMSSEVINNIQLLNCNMNKNILGNAKI